MNAIETALNLVVIRVADLDRSERFYSSLGIKFDRDRHGKGPEHLAARIGPTVLELYPASKGGDVAGSGVRLGFRVSSVLAVLTAAREAECVVHVSPYVSQWGLRAVVSDPDGHRIELVEII